MHALFSLAKKLQPTIIFLDEIDSFLRARKSQDHEATSQMKAEFMTLWDGLNTGDSSRILILGATNRPNDIDKVREIISIIIDRQGHSSEDAEAICHKFARKGGEDEGFTAHSKKHQSRSEF